MGEDMKGGGKGRRDRADWYRRGSERVETTATREFERRGLSWVNGVWATARRSVIRLVCADIIFLGLRKLGAVMGRPMGRRVGKGNFSGHGIAVCVCAMTVGLTGRTDR
ncbi:peroxidase superfamily protein [Striga asiatica]|uniref:Peroxidase superfamily protein n=1 Tax=Striga asiatica TaxID=4170 RepID=A0A5A7PGV1_STRAF|nr:peroxidase superfamily protein [Striga asiatica]